MDKKFTYPLYALFNSIVIVAEICLIAWCMLTHQYEWMLLFALLLVGVIFGRETVNHNNIIEAIKKSQTKNN